ncbi:MAG: DnaJ domain-containing protein [Nitrospinae bacterium]|nr:DnaJ domain-containing protein [Nitrospinota bacterium]
MIEKYFLILKLKPGSSLGEIKKAYKVQVRQWHPDRFPLESPRLQKKAHEKFQEITTAYKKLTEVHMKRRYAEASDWKGKSTTYTKAREERKKKQTQESDPGETNQVPGFTTHTWSNGDKYEGQMFREQMHGRGIFTCAKGYVYTGEFKHGKPNGLGKLVYDNGDQYEGNFLNDMLHGQGKYSYANGDCYRGEFLNDLPHGHGVYVLANGSIYSGNWENGSLATQ